MGFEMEAVKLTTDSSGDATGYTKSFRGLVHQIVYLKTDFADTVDFDITGEESAQDLWNEDNVTAAAMRHPRAPTQDNVGAASLYAGAGEPVEDRIAVVGRVKCVVANGGDTKTGTFLVYWET